MQSSHFTVGPQVNNEKLTSTEQRYRRRGYRLVTDPTEALMATEMLSYRAVIRLEGELKALRSRPWWRRLVG
jgi:hypothetical protein